MRTFVDNLGIFHKLMDGETPQEGWSEVIDKYKRYVAPNGDVHTILSEATPDASWVETPFEYIGAPDMSFVPPYNALRMNNYPQIGEQLDMLWHELNNNGTLSTDGDWFQSIQEIKTQYPKP
jgi:hypothetical protein